MSPKAREKRKKPPPAANGPTPAKVKRGSVVPEEEHEVAEEVTPKVPGILYVFGDGIAGQLGLGEDNTERGKPTNVPGLDNIIDIAAGGMHTVCLTAEQKVVTFGCNDEGALGRDTTEEGSEFTPGTVEIPTEAKVKQISAGDSHTAVLLEDGTVYVWGSFRDSHGPMGLLSRKKIEKTPVRVLTGIKIVKIASGSHHLIMLGKNKQLYSCGCAEQGQLGRVPERSASRESRHGMSHLLIPTVITFSLRLRLEFVDVWTGSFCTFAKERVKGEVYVFGLNNYRQIGLEGLGSHYRPSLSKPFSGIKWIKICGGEHHTAALDCNGKVYSMGRKEYGRLGLGQNCEDADKPTTIPQLSEEKCVDIACGSFVTFAVTENGKLYSWGMGSAQLGLGDAEGDAYSPQEVKGKLVGKKVVRVSSGGQHTVVLVQPETSSSEEKETSS